MEPVSCEGVGFIERVFSTRCDWPVSMLGWTYTLFFVFLGSAAAIFGHWLERAGPRKAGFVAALCWCGGLFISAFGVYTHQIWLLWLGSGVIGGIGLGLGYISPVSTLIKWFPDRRGMATGLAIMGFGGGAMIGAPLADRLMNLFASETVGRCLANIRRARRDLFGFDDVGGIRLPIAAARMAARRRRAVKTRSHSITSAHVHVNAAIRTPQFWLLWGVLCLNVSAGIGVIGMASPMLQEVFGGQLIGSPRAACGAGGEPTGASRDYRSGICRLAVAVQHRGTHRLGIGFGPPRPQADVHDLLSAGVRVVCLGADRGSSGPHRFLRGDLLRDSHDVRRRIRDRACIPGRSLRYAARRRDPRPPADCMVLRGHSRSSVVNYIREFQLARGVPAHQAYNVTMYVLASMLLLGLLCNLLIRPVNSKHHMTEEQIAKERSVSPRRIIEFRSCGGVESHAGYGQLRRTALARVDCSGDSTCVGWMDHAEQGAGLLQVVGKTSTAHASRGANATTTAL